MAAPSSAALLAAGYTLNNGVYSQTFGSIVVAFTLQDSGSGGLLVTPNGDQSPADIAAVQASLSGLGVVTASPYAAAQGLPPYKLLDLTAAGGTQSFGMSL